MIVLKKLGNYLWLGLMLLIILSGIIVGIGRLASPYLQDFKTDIEREASLLTDREIRIGSIKARWRGFGPKLILRNLEIRDRQQQDSPLLLKQVDLDLSLKSILYKGQLLPWNVTLHGLKLELMLDQAGNFLATGINHNSSHNSASYDLDPLFKLRRIELVNTSIKWTDQTGKTPDTHVEDINLLMRNDNRRHQIDLSFSLPATPAHNTGQSVTIAADLRARKNSLEKLSGDFYLKTRNFDAAAWLKPFIPQSISLQSADLTTETWASIEAGRLVSLEGSANIDQAVVNNVKTAHSLEINQLSGHFRWFNKHNRQQLAIEKLRFKTAEEQWPETRLAYIRQHGKLAYFSIDRFNADFWHDLKRFQPAGLSHQLPDIDLSGQVKQLHVLWNPGFTRWSAKGTLHDFSLTIPRQTPGPYASVVSQLPSIDRLTARFTASEQAGHVKINSTESTLDFPQVFREPLEISRLNGDLFWQIDTDKRLRLFSDYLELDTADLSTWSRLDISIPVDGSTYIDMQTDFRDGDGSSTSKYLPFNIMGEELISWLDRAIVSGDVTSGSFVFKGPVDDFAFSSTHNGHFEVLFNVENAILDYMDDWPRLEEVAAQVRFHNNSLTIDLESAKYLDSEISSARAFIASLDPTSPIQIKGKASGPASDTIRLLTESPLKEQFSQLKNKLVFKGRNKIDLDFQIPLESGRGEYRLDGRIHFQDNSLLLPDWGQQLDAIRGRLKFNLDGLESERLSASLLGSRSDIIIGHENNITHINTDIKLNARQINRLFSNLPQDILAGETQWQVKLSIPPLTDHDQPASIMVHSGLAGMALQAPQPLGKSLAKVAPLSVSVDLLADKPLPVTFTFDNNVHGKLKLVADKHATGVKSARIHFGDKVPAHFQQKHDEYRLSGKLKSLDLAPWLNWPALSDNPHNEFAAPIDIDLDIDQLNYRHLVLHELLIKAKKLRNTLNGTIKSREMQGSFDIPTMQPLGRLNIDLDTLKLSVNLADATQDSDSKISIDPAEVPSIDMQIKKLFLNEENFGQLDVKTTSTRNNVSMDQFRLDGPMLKLEGNGNWTSNLSDQETSIEAKLKSDDFGKVLKVLGYTPQIENGKAEIESALYWLDNPLNFDLPTLSGILSMRIEEGRFLDLEPGVGRILGILNIGALQRRLSLDFSDLFKEGFSFDQISANFDLLFGDAFTNDLLINSPSGTINLQGRTGLVNKDYDQNVTITPSLQSTITIAGAVAGGPAGAAIAYIAQKLVGNEVDKMARTRYTITGPWDKPTITKQNSPVTDEPEPLNILSNQ